MNKKQKITLLLTFFTALALLGTIFLVEKRQEIRKKAEEEIITTFTVCPQNQPGCNFTGGDGIQQAVNAASVGNSTQKTKIIIKPGTYTRQNYTEFVTNDGFKKKCFVGIQEKYLIFEGEGEAVLDGINSAYMDGFCVNGGGIKIINLKIKGFKKEGGCSLWGDSVQFCGAGIGIFLKNTQADIINIISENNEDDGVVLMGSSKAEIIGNQISKNGWAGISFWDSSEGNIKNNTISENNGYGIYLTGSSKAEIIGNQISKNGWA
ncbi:MAG: NosD domain-containing protein, partial [Microgenomates group bacterium]